VNISKIISLACKKVLKLKKILRIQITSKISFSFISKYQLLPMILIDLPIKIKSSKPETIKMKVSFYNQDNYSHKHSDGQTAQYSDHINNNETTFEIL